MMLRTLLAAASAAVIATSFAQAQDKPTVGLIQIDLSNPFHLGEVDGAKEAARRLALAMGLEEPAVRHAQDIGQGFSFYVVYGQCKHRVDLSTIKVAKPEFEILDKDEINRLIAEKMGRKMVVLGACIETDAQSTWARRSTARTWWRAPSTSAPT